ncbi:hypothetical protein CLPUN_07010 [Clostridium puniceum]|uniref:Uncharacterized protein n=1 Tax=Clostridium puniceum TaxID=29367 RepID=A0A1S8TW07_9CLOT|nr:hypothetical protein [Clostridium puniceum]OOM81947.1 hypothetical protein CLPUN_07010 [Clostridium puniceum]
MKLIEENPDLEIMAMVDTACVPSDDFSYWCADWGKAEIDEYYISDERIYFKSIDFDELVEQNMEFCEQEVEAYEGESEELAIKEVDKLNWIKAIVIHIDEFS